MHACAISLPVFLKSDILKTCCRVGYNGLSGWLSQPLTVYAGFMGDSQMRFRPADIIKIKICNPKI
jgi:hypothetical protein